MTVFIVEGIQVIVKDSKTFFNLHCISLEPVENRDGFSGRMVKQVFVTNDKMPADLKEGSKVKFYYDDANGRAYLVGIEVCK